MKRKDPDKIYDETVVKNEDGKFEKTTMSVFKKVLRFWPLWIYIIGCVLVILFIKSGDEDDLFKAHFKDGTTTVSVGDVDYTVLSIEDKDSYIGSFVSDKLNAVQDKKIASLRSQLLYVSVFFSVEGDEKLDYLMDGKKTIYVRKDMFDEASSYYNNEENMNVYKMTSKKKDLDTMNEVSKDMIDRLKTIDGEQTFVNDPTVAENYETRREIYGFYDNGIMYKAVLELFKYNNEVYITKEMIDGSKNKDVTVVIGVKLPEDMQEYFLNIW